MRNKHANELTHLLWDKQKNTGRSFVSQVEDMSERQHFDASGDEIVDDSRAKLIALSPLDGRYAHVTYPLRHYFSEYALIRSRIEVEIEWLIYQHECTELGLSSMSISEANLLRSVYNDFDLNDAIKIKEKEKTIRHDMKAVEYHIRHRLDSMDIGRADNIANYIHFCCTSDDVNSVCHALSVKGFNEDILTPRICGLMDALSVIVEKTCDIPILGMTHGQASSPSTFGKEMSVYLNRLMKVALELKQTNYYCKFGGAVGSYNAHVFVKPDVNWMDLNQRFIESQFKLSFQTHATQVDSNDWIAKFADCIFRMNTIILDLVTDLWLYALRGVMSIKSVAMEVGSSTMPHKTNPIDFENAEGNLEVANSLLRMLSSKLARSRLQRDLSNSTVLRNMGTAFGHCIVAYQSTLLGLDRIEVNRTKTHEELDAHWEILAEPFQCLLKSLGETDAYEQLKNITRGMTNIDSLKDVLHSFMRDKDMPQDILINRVLTLSPSTYLGHSKALALKAVDEFDSFKNNLLD